MLTEILLPKIANTVNQTISIGKPLNKMLLESTDLYDERHWAKGKQVNLKYLSEWKERVKELVVDHSYTHTHTHTHIHTHTHTHTHLA